MAKYYESTVSIPYYTGLPKDVVTNTFHWRWANTIPPDTTALNVLRDAHKSFYEYIFSSGSGVQMAQWMRPANTRFKLYDLETAKPRVPVRDEVISLTVGQDTTPQTNPEQALVGSYQATSISGDIKARRRGRIYLGGLGNNCQAGGSATSFIIPNPLLITRFNAAMKTLRDLSNTYDWFWSVYSPTTNKTQPLSASYFTVANGWIDNAWDTQRRRGNTAGTRTTWS